MGLAVGAHVLDTGDEPLAVGAVLDLVARNWSVEAGPASTAIELGIAGEQWFVADDAVVGALICVLVVLVRIGTCLLYTSPSPRDATLTRMPSSA